MEFTYLSIKEFIHSLSCGWYFQRCLGAHQPLNFSLSWLLVSLPPLIISPFIFPMHTYLIHKSEILVLVKPVVKLPLTSIKPGFHTRQDI